MGLAVESLLRGWIEHGWTQGEVTDADNGSSINSSRSYIPKQNAFRERIGVSVRIHQEMFVRERAAQRGAILIGVRGIAEIINLIDPPLLGLGGVGHGIAPQVRVGTEEKTKFCGQYLTVGIGDNIDGIAIRRPAVKMIDNGDGVEVGDVEALGLALQQSSIRDGSAHNVARTVSLVSRSYEKELIHEVGLGLETVAET